VAVPVIEDAAQAIGAGPVRGQAAALSFFPTKNLGACGDGGAVLTDDAAWPIASRSCATTARGRSITTSRSAANFRLDALQAAILDAKLPHLPGVDRGASGARRPLPRAPRPRCRRGRCRPTSRPRLSPLRRARGRRDRLRAHLTAAGIGTEIYYPSPLHLQPASWPTSATAPAACPRAEAACAEVLALPLYPTLPATAVDRVAAAVRACYRG
jgi:dTDP-4-amino-4,6-dideoxygalactose transaminase